MHKYLTMRSRRASLAVLLLLCALCGLQRPALAYIDPGTGQQVWMSLGPLVGVLLASLAIILWPLRWAWHMVRPYWLKLPRWGRIAVASVAVAGAICGLVFVGMAVFGGDGEEKSFATAGSSAETGKAAQMEFNRALIIGMDGLDPKRLGTMMDAGELPNFARLRAEGAFSPLQTTVPPESPVAWTSAATGCNPGQNGIFDFIGRDPKTYLPDLALLRSKKQGMFSKGDSPFIPATDQRAMWDILSENGIPVSVIRWPVTFPPPQMNGRMLSGLGTPDVCGLLGRYRFFTTAEIAADDKAADRVTRVQWEGKSISTAMPGPEVMSLTGTKTSTVPLKIERSGAADEITVALDKNAPFPLKVGGWSDWQTVSFPGGLSRACPAMVKLYLTSIEPEFNLYISAPNIVPANPAFPISWPKEFSKELADEIGLYATLGMPEDGQAVEHGRIPLGALLESCDQITTEREKMFDSELKRFTTGALFVVFDTSDRIQHMFWAAADPSHPMHTAELESQFGSAIANHYRRMDKVIGKALDAASDGRTALFVISDHGFTSFRRAVHLNTWLAQSGFLTLKDGAKEGAPLLRNVDWAKTKAYAVGFCSLYVNLKGRDGQGSVEQSEYQNVCEALSRGLKAWQDSAGGEPVVRNVYFKENVYRGRHVDEAPDLIVGYYPGYRASWQTALGAAPAEECVVANNDLWSGDHLVDAATVPGSFLSNIKITERNPRLIDLAPSVLKSLGIAPGSDMDGKPLF